MIITVARDSARMTVIRREGGPSTGRELGAAQPSASGQRRYIETCRIGPCQGGNGAGRYQGGPAETHRLPILEPLLDVRRRNELTAVHREVVCVQDSNDGHLPHVMRPVPTRMLSN